MFLVWIRAKVYKFERPFHQKTVLSFPGSGMQVEAMVQELTQPVLVSLSELHISSWHNERKGAALTQLSSSAHSTVHLIQELKEAIVSYSFFQHQSSVSYG